MFSYSSFSEEISDDVYKHMQKFFKHIDPNYEMKDPKSFYEDTHE